MSRPYQDPLTSSFRRVFKQLDLPWVIQRGRPMAIALALFVGLFGAHQFYLGNRRRALYYLAFCWALVPLFLAWFDAIRLALMNKEDFERKFDPCLQTDRALR